MTTYIVYFYFLCNANLTLNTVCFLHKVSVPVVSSLIKPQPSIKSVSLLLSTIHPYLATSSLEERIALDLKKVEKLVSV